MLCEFYNEKLEYQENILTKYYGKYNHDVVVITSTYDSVFDYYSGNYNKKKCPGTYYDSNAKIIKLRYKFNFFNKLRMYTCISAILKSEKPDLIYVHDIIPNMLEAVQYVKVNPNCKMIMDYHADYSNSGKNWLSLAVLHGIIRKWYLDKARPYIKKIFPVVPAGTKFLNEIYKVPLDEMEVLPLGADVDLGKQCVDSNRLSAVRERYGFSADCKVVLTGGKLSPRKKTELLIKAVERFPTGSVVLLIIGDFADTDKDYRDYLLELSEKNPNIHFTGWLNKVDVYEHLAISDVAVFPASQSILWQQAISMGLPLIVGNTGEQSIEYLNLYNNIVSLEHVSINENEIFSNLKQIISNKLLYEEMSDGARRVTKECLDWNVLINRTLRFNRT